MCNGGNVVRAQRVIIYQTWANVLQDLLLIRCCVCKPTRSRAHKVNFMLFGVQSVLERANAVLS
jgi:hypothetical protein